MKTQASKLLIGAHTSAAGGVHNALLEGQKIGATTIQLFTANQRQWKVKTLDKVEIQLWKETLQATGLKEIMSHDSYLINLGAPDPENLAKSRAAFAAEIERCTQLDVTYLNFHPGAALKSDPQECLDRIVESLLECRPLLDGHKTRLLLEATAGQGSAIGWRFEELAYLVERLEKKLRVGVCIDTCHIFVAGYDIRTKEGWDHTLKEFDKIVGLKHLYAFHLNDSMKPLGSRVDRHQDLGKGQIGMESFHFLMRDARTRDLPKYLETPGGVSVWEKEIETLRELAT
ncbi:MAG: deoxyribonuclease IV [Parachlamydia sp.]|nr:deoxyribonuclease IV [Parachlamydia sp.]